MKQHKFGMSDLILKKSYKPKENIWGKEDGLLIYMIKQAKDENPNHIVKTIDYRFDPKGDEGGSHLWTLNLATMDELK